MRIAVPCPHCERDLIDDAREVWFIQGLLIVTRYGSHRHIGCARCVRGKVIANIAEVAVMGWWSMWGLLASPFVLLQNLFCLFAGPSDVLLRSVLAQVGIDADEVELDAFGRTREQDRTANAILDVLAEATWADGAASADKITNATAVAFRMVSEAFSPEEVVARLQKGTRATIPDSVRRNPDRVILLRAALAVVGGGILTKVELGFIWDLAMRLNLPNGIVERLLRDAGVGTGSGAFARPRGLDRAAQILQVPPSATPREAKVAHRRHAMKHHPDKAGNDPKAIQQANTRMAELNWAYEQFAAEGDL